MALVFGDSFDHYNVADITKKWTATTATGAEVVLGSAYALPPHGQGLLFGSNSRYLEKTLPAALATFICGFWYRASATPGAYVVATFMDSSTVTNIHVSVRLDATAHLTLCRDATVLATSTNTLTASTWYHIEIKATIADATSGCYEVRVNGTATNWIPAVSNADTRNSGNASIGSVRIYGGQNHTTAGACYQDFYILDTTGTQASDFLGPCRFAVIRPVGAGNSAQLTGNYADNWSNVVEGDGDSAFNQSATAGHIDLFTMTDVPAGTIHAIQHVLYARQDAGAQRVLRPKTRIGGTNYNGVSVNLAATHVMYTEPVMFSPATGGATAFTAAEINGMEAGYEVVS